MKKIIFATIVVLFSMSAQASRWSVAESTAIRALETTAGQRLLSVLTGKSQAEVVAMSLQAQESLLAAKMAASESGELSESVNQAITALANGEKNSETLVSAIINNPANKAYLSNVSAGSFLIAKNPQTSAATKMLRERAASGDLEAAAVSEFTTTVAGANKALGIDILGTGAEACMKLYPSRMVGNLMALTSALKNSAAVVNTKTAFQALTKKSQALFKDTAAKAQERVCGLAGQGYKCRIFNPAMCAL